MVVCVNDEYGQTVTVLAAKVNGLRILPRILKKLVSSYPNLVNDPHAPSLSVPYLYAAWLLAEMPIAHGAVTGASALCGISS